MRILIVRLSSIGDIVHALPVLAAIRRALPRAEITWAVERPAVEILRDNPSLDHLIEVDTKALRRWPVSGETLMAQRQQLRRLRASSFDAALDLQGLFKSAIIARLARTRRTYGFTREALREPLSRFLLAETIRVPLFPKGSAQRLLRPYASSITSRYFPSRLSKHCCAPYGLTFTPKAPITLRRRFPNAMWYALTVDASPSSATPKTARQRKLSERLPVLSNQFSAFALAEN